MEINSLPEDMIAEILLRAFECSLLEVFTKKQPWRLRSVCTKWKLLTDNHPTLKQIANSFERAKLLELARSLEIAERYDELFKLMGSIAKYSKYPLSVDERNMMAVSFKNIVGRSRVSIRALQNPDNAPKTISQQDVLMKYMQRVADELRTDCTTVLELVEKYLIPNAAKKDFEQIAFYYKMRGDYSKYVLEYFCSDEQLKELSRQSYETAFHLVTSYLPALNSIRLAVGMHYAIYLYEIANEQGKAVELLRTTYQNAMAEVTEDTDYNSEQMMVLRLLETNIPHWAMHNQTETEEE